MKILNIDFLEEIYPLIKEKSLQGKWITLENIKPLYEGLDNSISKKTIGTSEEGRDIYKVVFGNGIKKILIWSQMHGNESTGTKAVFDLLNFFKSYKNSEIVKTIFNNCTIEIIPMLNPDGAIAYTRFNSNEVDLNRDAVNLNACESILLRKRLEEMNPEFCFNLHDQRTIFGVEGTGKPATISFLAPSEEESRSLTDGRKETMNVIVAMNELLQKIIPDYVGRYSDEFYPTATGDNFQKLGHNTILIEAGHYPNDYERENTRKFNFFALLQGIYHISINKEFKIYKPYFNIPNNIKNFYDVIHRYKKGDDIGFLYEDKVVDNQLISQLREVQKGKLETHYGHIEIDFEY